MAKAGTRGGTGSAAGAMRRAQAVSVHARRTGCGLAEAAEAVDRTLSRRRFLIGTAAAVSVVSGGVVAPDAASAASRRRQGGRVVIVGAGIAGLGCAYQLWRRHGIGADVYEYDNAPGGRIRTLRGYFEGGYLAEQHAEFINPEHSATLALAKSFGLTLDNATRYPPGTHPRQETMRFGGRFFSQTSLDQDWHDWGWELFHDAAFAKAPWPTLYNQSTEWARRFDRMSVAEWLDTYVPGGANSDFGSVCVAAALDEFGGPADEQSALNLVYLLGQDASKGGAVQPRARPQLAGADEKWHVHGGNDQLISGLVDRLPAGTVRLGQQLVALRATGGGGFTCSFQSGAGTTDVAADHVVLSLPFTTLRQVDLAGVEISPLHLRAVEEEPLGSNSKFFLEFSERLWDEHHRSGNVFCDGVVQGGWDATNYQPGQSGILVALPGGHDGEHWGPRYGLTTYAGPAPDAMVADYLSGWDRLFPGVKDAYTGRSYYVWSPGDPHILGAYSYLKVGQFTGFNGIQGQREGNLHFAGEHTSVNYQGYIEGGLRSGYRCAGEVMGRA